MATLRTYPLSPLDRALSDVLAQHDGIINEPHERLALFLALRQAVLPFVAQAHARRRLPRNPVMTPRQPHRRGRTRAGVG